MKGRYYDPNTGRFLSRDPVSGYLNNPLSQNAYIYGYDNAVNIDDPTGADPADNYVVYISKNAEGVIQYIGITSNFDQRKAAHQRIKGISVQKIPGLENLSRAQARSIEQYLININGGPIKEGKGPLLNKINL